MAIRFNAATFKTKPTLPAGLGKLRFCPHLVVKENRSDCCYQPEKPPKRPDPGIYSQQERYTAGNLITWDSPDITTNLSSGQTLDDNVIVTVRNYSTDSSALGTQVMLEYSQFGIGFPKSELAIQNVNLNMQGRSGDEQSLDFFLPVSIRKKLGGNISVFVMVSHPHDRYTGNNIGEQSWSASSVQKGQSERFTFQIHNSLSVVTQFDLLVLESDWNPVLDTNQTVLIPGQAQNINLTVQVPADAVQSKSFNVVALAGGSLYGGIYHRFDV